MFAIVLKRTVAVGYLLACVGLGPEALAQATVWSTLKIGAGGFVHGIDISDDATTIVARTDVYGAYIWDSVRQKWNQLLTTNRLHIAEAALNTSQGVYEIVVAPSDPSRIYMFFHGNIFVSSDRGTSFSPTSFKRVTDADPNQSPSRSYGPRMAVDPINPDVVYAGTPTNGLFVSIDGGTTWSSVTAVPAAASIGCLIAFDRSSAAIGRKISTIYASSYGNGLYVSTDAGARWAKVAGSPTTFKHIHVALDGVVYIVDQSASFNKIWRYANSAWANITPETAVWASVLSDPFNVARVVAVRGGGYVDVSLNRGVTWAGLRNGAGWGGPCWKTPSNIRVASDIPWLASTRECFMTAADMRFDPVTPDKVWFAEGIGIWTTFLSATGPPQIVFTSQNQGIEELVAKWIVSPPGGKPLVFAMDRPVFYISDPDSYPSAHGPNYANAIVHGYSADYAPRTPSFVAAIMENSSTIQQSGYSTDGGLTWTQFATVPVDVSGGKMGGAIAVSTPTNMVWFAADWANPYYTIDQGTTWSLSSFGAEVPRTGETGWGAGNFHNRQIVVADRVLLNTFYAYNYGPPGHSSAGGTYRSADGGATWTHVSDTTFPSSHYSAIMRAVPGHAGHLFFSSGNQAPTNSKGNLFYRSIDGGNTWTSVASVNEVWAFGFGAHPPGKTYPTIFIAGYVNQAWGIWRSDDNALTWERISDGFPLESFDRIVTIQGDADTYGTVYVGFSGSGFAYGKLN